ncbi:MAG: hypothetical protein K2W92_00635 [Alphaproteobacteria bacterium]|nr:hypothetical protein [Alphaproteobacteria bacterium]
MKIIKYKALYLISFSLFFLLEAPSPGFSVLIEEDLPSSNSTVISSANPKKNTYSDLKQELEIHDWEKIHSIINEIKNIKSVFVHAPYHADQGIELLNEIPPFQCLQFTVFGHANDQTLKAIPSVLSNLMEFHAPFNKIGEEGLEALSKSATKLEVLDLTNNPGVNDRGISYISALPNLKKLYLSNTNITSESIKYLKLLNNLEELHVVGTSINKEDLADLKSALPKLQQHGAIRSNKFL